MNTLALTLIYFSLFLVAAEVFSAIVQRVSK